MNTQKDSTKASAGAESAQDEEETPHQLRQRAVAREWDALAGKAESAPTVTPPGKHTPQINALAREWADHVGGFKQAQKVIREAFEAGQSEMAAQRDELLAACKAAATKIDRASFPLHADMVDAAITKAEGNEFSG